jgi:hypothetical protein
MGKYVKNNSSNLLRYRISKFLLVMVDAWDEQKTILGLAGKALQSLRNDFHLLGQEFISIYMAKHT